MSKKFTSRLLVPFAALLLGMAVLLTACGEPEPERSEAPQVAPEPAPAPTPPPAPEPPVEEVEPPVEEVSEPMEYGDDPYLDGLWDDCAYGDYGSCESLYWESPIGSDYEDYGRRRMDELEPVAPELTDEEIQLLSLEMVWASMTTSERNDICLGVDLFGSDGAAAMILEGAPDFSASVVEDWLIETCS